MEREKERQKNREKEKRKKAGVQEHFARILSRSPLIAFFHITSSELGWKISSELRKRACPPSPPPFSLSLPPFPCHQHSQLAHCWCEILLYHLAYPQAAVKNRFNKKSSSFSFAYVLPFSASASSLQFVSKLKFSNRNPVRGSTMFKHFICSDLTCSCPVY